MFWNSSQKSAANAQTSLRRYAHARQNICCFHTQSITFGEDWEPKLEENLTYVGRKPSVFIIKNIQVYDLVYFDRRDQFDPSMGSSDNWWNNSGQTS